MTKTVRGRRRATHTTTGARHPPTTGDPTAQTTTATDPTGTTVAAAANARGPIPGHPHAPGTLPMAHHLTEPAIEHDIQTLAAQAPPMTLDQATRLARLLHLHPRHTHPRNR